jgi:hypothetical protein
VNHKEPVKSLWRGLLGKERRKAERRAVPGLVAYYWDGGPPAPHPVREISLTGMYLLTAERWYLGTVVRMRLQQTETPGEDPDRSIAVHARAVRLGEDGVAMAFLPQWDNPYQNGNSHRNPGSDSESMKRFFRQV